MSPKKKAEPKKPATNPPCKHSQLHFTDGGLYIQCANKDCSQAWQAVQKNKLTPDFMARAWGLGELNIRRDPLA